MAPKSNRGFMEIVGATIGSFKKDGYDKVSTDEGRVALPEYTPSADYRNREVGLQALEEEEGLLDTKILKRQRRRWSKTGLLCKAIVIIVAVFLVISAGKLIMWAFGPASTGLEGMPVFSESLGCMDDASYFYNDGETTLSIPIGDRNEHSIDIRGTSVGTIIVTEAPADVTEVQYKFTIRSNDISLVDEIDLTYPGATSNSDSTSRLLITTPHLPRDSPSCLRYDVIMYIPKALKKLHVSSHALAHVKFDPEAHIDLDDTFVTLFALKDNLLVPHQNLRSKNLALEIYQGWIAGHMSIVDKANVATQRGDGTMNVHVHPTAPTNLENPETVQFQTSSGAGRTDVFFENDKAFAHRPIKSLHTSAMQADVYLTYKKAQFNGNVNLGASSFTTTGAKAYSLGGSKDSWTHWVGDMNGQDELVIKSRGWTGLYF
jgi:hypothetical protein